METIRGRVREPLSFASPVSYKTAREVGLRVGEAMPQTNVAIIAPRDEPFTSGHLIPKGSSRGAMTATLKTAPTHDSPSRKTPNAGTDPFEVSSFGVWNSFGVWSLSFEI